MGFGSFVSGAGESLTFFSLYRRVARDRPSHYGKIGDIRITVGRGPVPRQATGSSSGCEGQARALRRIRANRITVGRGPVPRQASRSSSGCEGQALALRKIRRKRKHPDKHPDNRRAGACPPPSIEVVERSRGTGPRATENRNGLFFSLFFIAKSPTFPHTHIFPPSQPPKYSKHTPPLKPPTHRMSADSTTFARHGYPAGLPLLQSA